MESSWTRDRTHVSCISRQILIHWSTREVLGAILKGVPKYSVIKIQTVSMQYFFKSKLIQKAHNEQNTESDFPPAEPSLTHLILILDPSAPTVIQNVEILFIMDWGASQP